MNISKYFVHMSRIIEVVLVALTALSFSQYSEDTCNWILWDSAEDVDGIRTVKPSCAEGVIQWKHPYGAIRVLFSQYVPFEVCFIATSVRNTIQISNEEYDNLKQLILLTDHKGGTDREICVKSAPEHHNVVIYIESVLDTTSTVGHFVLEYDIRKTDESNGGRGMLDCKACTDNEIVEAVCYSDFVVKGEIEHVANLPDIGESQVYINLNKLYRQSHQVFKRSIEVTKDDNINSEQLTKDNNNNNDLLYKGHVIVPHRCRTSKGDGLFIFMGKIRLKRAHLTCAPRYEDFQRLWKEAMRNGANNCVLG